VPVNTAYGSARKRIVRARTRSLRGDPCRAAQHFELTQFLGLCSLAATIDSCYCYLSATLLASSGYESPSSARRAVRGFFFFGGPMKTFRRFIWIGSIAIVVAVAAAAATWLSKPGNADLSTIGSNTAASAQPGAVQAHASEPIKIGVAVGLSGANSVVAPTVVQSAQLAVEEINAAGGILGRKIQLEIVDDASG